MKPITTHEELGQLEDIFRHSERLRIVQYMRTRGKEANDAQVKEAITCLATEIKNGEHWESYLRYADGKPMHAASDFTGPAKDPDAQLPTPREVANNK